MKKTSARPLTESNLNKPSASGSTFDKKHIPRRLIISIDDIMESPICSKAQKFLKKVQNAPDCPSHSTLLEVYTCRRVFINSNEEGSLLYFEDPTPGSPLVSLPRSHVGKGESEAFAVLLNTFVHTKGIGVAIEFSAGVIPWHAAATLNHFGRPDSLRHLENKSYSPCI